MIGIFALAGWRPSELAGCAKNIAVGMATKSSWETGVWVGDQIACGRVGPPCSGATWTSSDGVYRAWLDGFAFTPHALDHHKDCPVSAADLAKALLFRGPEALLDFQGEFFLVVVDESQGKLFAATDRFGIRTTYRYLADGRLALCSEPGVLVRLGLIEPKLNKPFVMALLRFNKCRLGERTIFRGVSVFPPGTVQEYALGRLCRPREQVYYQHQFRDELRTEDEWFDALIPALRHAVHSAIKRSRGCTALALSGGLDSRMLLAAADGEERSSLRSFSCGLPESDDVRLAAMTASTIGGKYQNINLEAPDYLELARTSVRRNEEFDIFVQGGQAALHTTAAAEATALMTGWDVDIPLRGTYLNSGVLGLSRHSEVKQVIDVNWRLFSNPELSDLLQDSFYREFGDAPEDWLSDVLALLPQNTPSRLYLQFIFQFEKRRLLMLRNRMIRFELESATPFYDVQLQTLMAGIPEALKINNRLFARLFLRLAPELASIPYQRTMLPASVPVEYWTKGARLEEEREALLRDIFCSTGIRIPYTRHYSNFDEWLASNESWQRFTEQLLDSAQTLITQEIVKPAAVKALLAAHKTGPFPHRAKLIYLLSLELYLREYFN